VFCRKTDYTSSSHTTHNPKRNHGGPSVGWMGEMDGTKNKRENIAHSTVPVRSLVNRADTFIFSQC